jgi:hypothetical protein
MGLFRQRRVSTFLVKNKASIWVALSCWALAGFMGHPTVAGFVTWFVMLLLLFLLRWIAHIEASHESYEDKHEDIDTGERINIV